MTKKRLAIIDDDADVREGLGAWLSKDFNVVTYESAESFLRAPDGATDVDCLLLDLRMPGVNGLELQAQLAERDFTAPIIFMSGDAQKADILSAWRSGAANFILKPFSAEELNDALEKAMSRASLQLGDAAPGPAVPDLPITRREAQVLLLLGEGLQQQDVAKRLGISLRTVKMYRSFLSDKLGLSSLVEIGQFHARHRDLIKRMAQADATPAKAIDSDS